MILDGNPHRARKHDHNGEHDRAARPARIVVVVDASTEAMAALRSAAALAAQQHLPLLAVIADEPARARSAAYPFACEVGALSGAIRPLDRAAVARRLDPGAAEIRRIVARITRQAGVAWEAVVVRERVVDEVLAVSARGDLLMLAHASALARPGRGLVEAALRLARGAAGSVQISAAVSASHRERVAVLIDDLAAGPALLGAAAVRARMSSRRLVVLAAPDAGQRQLARLKDLLASAGIRARVRSLATLTTGELLRVLAEENAAELVVARGGAWLDSPAAERLLARWRLPVLVAPGRAD
ncbi:MAG TPA: hypothetical protein VK972_04100 [Wenzhouxiangella sp.]|nr:hypothetical protein [Wenzhouxiangella sp.]